MVLEITDKPCTTVSTLSVSYDSDTQDSRAAEPNKGESSKIWKNGIGAFGMVQAEWALHFHVCL